MIKNRKKKILIVGCMGYLGSFLSDYFLKKKYKCEGIDTGFFKNCNLYKEKKLKVKKKSASQINEEDIKDFDVVIQLAAFSNDPFGNLDSKKFYKPTEKYTINIAKICKKLNKKFIFPSSCSVYGYGKNIFNEKSRTSPLTEYSKNKIHIENKLKKIETKKFRPIILRLATVYGISPRIRLDVVINMLTSMVVASNIIKLNSNGLAWRPHLNINDVARIFEKFINQKTITKKNIYNIGSNENNYRIIDVAKILNKISPSSQIKFLNQTKIRNSLVIDKKIQDGVDKRSYRVSFNKIQNKFPNYKFISLEKGIRDLIRKLKKYKMNKYKFSSVNYYRLQKLDQINSKNKIVI